MARMRPFSRCSRLFIKFFGLARILWRSTSCLSAASAASSASIWGGPGRQAICCGRRARGPRVGDSPRRAAEGGRQAGFDLASQQPAPSRPSRSAGRNGSRRPQSDLLGRAAILLICFSSREGAAAAILTSAIMISRTVGEPQRLGGPVLVGPAVGSTLDRNLFSCYKRAKAVEIWLKSGIQEITRTGLTGRSGVGGGEAAKRSKLLNPPRKAGSKSQPGAAVSVRGVPVCPLRRGRPRI